MFQRSLLLLCGGLLSAACSADAPSGDDPPAHGGAGSSSAGAGGAATNAGTAGQAPTAGSNAGGSLGASGAGGVGGSLGGTGGSVAGTESGASAGSAGAGAGGGAPHAGDGCVPGAGTGFDTSFEGVVLDRKTCLVWQRQDPPRDQSSCALKRADIPSSLCFAAAQAYCDSLVLDGQSDWRLPTVAELQTLVASPPPTPPAIPTIDHDAFPDAIANLYWSSELSGGKVHCADFNGGPPTSNTGPDGPQALRCVRP